MVHVGAKFATKHARGAVAGLVHNAPGGSNCQVSRTHNVYEGLPLDLCSFNKFECVPPRPAAAAAAAAAAKTEAEQFDPMLIRRSIQANIASFAGHGNFSDLSFDFQQEFVDYFSHQPGALFYHCAECHYPAYFYATRRANLMTDHLSTVAAAAAAPRGPCAKCDKIFRVLPGLGDGRAEFIAQRVAMGFSEQSAAFLYDHSIHAPLLDANVTTFIPYCVRGRFGEPPERSPHHLPYDELHLAGLPLVGVTREDISFAITKLTGVNVLSVSLSAARRDAWVRVPRGWGFYVIARLDKRIVFDRTGMHFCDKSGNDLLLFRLICSLRVFNDRARFQDYTYNYVTFELCVPRGQPAPKNPHEPLCRECLRLAQPQEDGALQQRLWHCMRLGLFNTLTLRDANLTHEQSYAVSKSNRMFRECWLEHLSRGLGAKACDAHLHLVKGASMQRHFSFDVWPLVQRELNRHRNRAAAPAAVAAAGMCTVEEAE